MSKIILSIFVVSVGVLASYSIIALAQAPDIAYPVKELGNCKSETECRTFCDKPENIKVCVDFAKRHNLLSDEEIEKAEAFIKIGEGPGGCKSKDECEAFCDNSQNIEICLDFAERNDLLDEEELAEARKVSKALAEGALLPGGCQNKENCEAYCDNPEHIEECIAFAEKADLIPPDELKDARKAMKAMKSGIKPPGNCRGKKQCEAFCSEPEHMEECFAFAEAAGFIPPEEAEMAKKMMPLMKAGKMPGGCKGKKQCESYCENESHMEECANFAIEAGLMKPEEAEMFRKTGGKGPGNCRGREECEGFCNNPENQEICFNFAQEHSLMPPGEIEKIREGMSRMKEGLEMAPPEIKSCLEQTVGAEIIGKIQTGTLTPGPQIGEQVRTCFEQMGPREMLDNLPRRDFEGKSDFMRMPEGIPEEFKNMKPEDMPEEFQRMMIEGQMQNFQNRMPPESFEGIRPPEGFQPPESFISPDDMMPPLEIMNQIMPGIMPEGNMTPPEGMIMPPIEMPYPSSENLGSNFYQIFFKLFKDILY